MSKALLENELIIAVDFDGTMTTSPDMGNELVLRDNCKEVLERLHDDGIRLILWTCRAGKSLDECLSFLVKNELLKVFDTVNEQLPEITAKYMPHVAKKIGADFYIEDKSLPPVNINWREIEKFLYGEDD